MFSLLLRPDAGAIKLARVFVSYGWWILRLWVE